MDIISPEIPVAHGLHMVFYKVLEVPLDTANCEGYNPVSPYPAGVAVAESDKRVVKFGNAGGQGETERVKPVLADKNVPLGQGDAVTANRVDVPVHRTAA